MPVAGLLLPRSMTSMSTACTNGVCATHGAGHWTDIAPLQRALGGNLRRASFLAPVAGLLLHRCDDLDVHRLHERHLRSPKPQGIELGIPVKSLPLMRQMGKRRLLCTKEGGAE